MVWKRDPALLVESIPAEVFEDGNNPVSNVCMQRSENINREYTVTSARESTDILRLNLYQYMNMNQVRASEYLRLD